MRRSPRYSTLIFVTSVALLSLVALTAPLVSQAALLPSPEEQVQHAWQRAQESGAYRFTTQIVQTTYPAPALVNVGRSSSKDTLYIEGHADLPERAMLMTMWKGGGSILDRQDGVEVRVEGDQAYGRPIGGTWQEVDDFSGAFAPGSDLMAYLAGARDVRELGTETRALPGASAGERTTGDTAPPSASESSFSVTLTHYSFEVDGPAFAEYLRAQLEDHLRENGKLPLGLTLDSSNTYRGVTGQGEIWIDSRGLPLRLSVHLVYPRQRNGERIEADIQTDFADFAPLPEARSLLGQVVGALGLPRSPRDWQQTGQRLSVGASLLGLTLLVVVHRRSKKVYAAFVLAIVFSLVVVPLLQTQQVYAFFQQMEVQRSEQEQLQEGAQAAADLQQELLASDWDPHVDPLAARDDGSADAAIDLSAPWDAGHPSPAQSSSDDDIDTDGDGLTDAQENAVGTDLRDADSDNDGLNDGIEVLKLGTDPNEADTDGDGITDFLEVRGFARAGGLAPWYSAEEKRWYSDPNDPDTNGDGLLDGAECPERVTVSTQSCQDENKDGVPDNCPQLAQTCQNTDGLDLIPDLFDEDNDGDGVPDRVDLSPFTKLGYDTDTPFAGDRPFQLTVDNLIPNYPVFVDVQLRPTNPRHLTYALNVLDWPSGDEEGQVQRRRGNNSTFGSVAEEEGKPYTARDTNGDMRLVPMLEITIPYLKGHYANLPVKPGAPDIAPSTPITAWLDADKLAPYGISVRKKDNDGTLLVYAPLNVVSDESGGGRVAFSGRMLYWPESEDWGTTHQVRVVWLVLMLTDRCKPVLPGTSDEDAAKWCEKEVNWTLNSAQPVHTYGEEWTLTGLSVREDHGLEVAIALEDPVGDVDPQTDDWLWQLARGLEVTFVAGRGVDTDGDGEPDVRDITVSEIERRFGITSTATITERWGIPLTATLDVETFAYRHQDCIAHIAMTETARILDDHFGSAGTPTLLFAHESHYRSIALDLDDWDEQVLTVDADPVRYKEETIASLKWEPYRRQEGKWESYPIDEYWDQMEVQYKRLFRRLFPEDEEDVIVGKMVVARAYYVSFRNGVAGLVQTGQDVLWTPAPGQQGSDTELAERVKTAIELVGGNSAQTGYGALLFGVVKDIAKEAAEAFEKYRWFNRFLTTFGENPLFTSRQMFFKGVGQGFRGLRGYASDWATLFRSGQGWRRGFARAGTGLAALGAVAGVGLTIYGCTQAEGVDIAVNVVNGLSLIMEITGLVQLTVGVVREVGRSTTTTIAAALRTVSNVSKATKVLGVVGVIIGVLTTWGVFIGTMAAGGVKAGSLAFNAALAGAIASTIVAVIMFAIAAIPVVGQIIAAIIGLIDAVIAAICGALGVTEEDYGICKGISGWLAEGIKWLLYSSTIMVDLGAADRLKVQHFQQNVSDPDGGIAVGNALGVQATITNTIVFTHPSSWQGYVYGWQYSEKNLKSSTFDYKFQTTDQDIHDNLLRGSMVSDWMSAGNGVYIVRQPASGNNLVSLNEAGINRPVQLYLSEGHAVPAQECWSWPPIVVCYVRDEKDTTSIDMGQDLKYDVFPAKLDAFYEPAEKGGGYSLGWGQAGPLTFPRQVDFDGDGLRNAADGGSDRNDSAWDTDGDGLSDYDEDQTGTDNTNPDSDGDGLDDRQEALLGTDPLRADSDGDGLTDREEVEGWAFAYALDGAGNPLRTWVTSDPQEADGDGDGLTDLREKTFGFHPRVPSESTVLTFESEVREVRAPRALLRFEEAPGAAVFVDASGYGNTAACTGDGCPVVVEGRYGSALQFDGVDDRVVLENVENSGRASVAVWVYRTGETGMRESLVSYQEHGGCGFVLSLNEDGMSHYPRVWVNVDGRWEYAEEPRSVPPNAWVHLAGTYDGQTIRLYRDGQEVASRDAPGGMRQCDGRTAIGSRSSEDKLYFPGRIDEVALFDWALSMEDVQALMQARYEPNDMLVRPGDSLGYRATVKNELLDRRARGLLYPDFSGALEGEVPPTSFVLPPTEQETMGGTVRVADTTVSGAISLTQVAGALIGELPELSTSPVLWLKLEEGPGATKFVDSSGRNHHGFCGNYCPVADGEDQPGVRFDGVNDGIVKNPHPDLDLETFTVGAWVMPTQQRTDWQTLIRKDRLDGGRNYGLYIRPNSMKVHFSFQAGNCSTYHNYDSAGSLALNAWTHVMMTYDGTHFNLYLNGSLDRSVAPNANGVCLSDGWLQIGSLGYQHHPFAGRIDDVLVFDRALPPEAVHQLYQLWRTEAHLRFDDPPGSKHFRNEADLTGLCDGSCAGAACPTAGVSGRDNGALYFDGVEDYVTLGDFQIEDRITLAAWVRPQAIDGIRNIIAHGYTTNPPGEVFLRIYDGTYQVGSWDGSDHLTEYPMPPGDVGQWVHLAGVYDGMHWRLYRNGVQVSAAPSGVGAVQVNAAWAVGARGTGTERFFQGTIDDVRISRVALSAAEIRSLYKAAPQFHLRLDEGAGASQFADSSGNGNHGTCSGSSCPTAGVKGQLGLALNFDGVDDHVAFENLGDFATTTVAAWVYRTEETGTRESIVSYKEHGGCGFVLSLNEDGTSHYPRVRVNVDGTWQYAEDPHPILLNAWVHLAGTYDGQTIRLYRNGQEVASQPAPGGMRQCDQRTAIGSRSSEDMYYFPGRIDEVTLHDHALSSFEIGDMFRYQAQWVQERQSHAVTVDAEPPISILRLDAPCRADRDAVMHVEAHDNSSGVMLVEFGVRKEGQAAYTWITAPHCMDAVGDTAWCPTFLPSGEGRYEIQVRATDRVGHREAPAQTYVVDVDGTAPQISVDPELPDGALVGAGLHPSRENAWAVYLIGRVGDPPLPGGHAGSGVPADGVWVTLLTAEGAPAGEGKQQALIEGDLWSVEYIFLEAEPTGAYTVSVEAVDAMGNRTSVPALSTLQVDATAPAASLDVSTIPPDVLTSTLAIAGTATERPVPVAVTWATDDGGDEAGLAVGCGGVTLLDAAPGTFPALAATYRWEGQVHRGTACQVQVTDSAGNGGVTGTVQVCGSPVASWDTAYGSGTTVPFAAEAATCAPDLAVSGVDRVEVAFRPTLPGSPFTNEVPPAGQALHLPFEDQPGANEGLRFLDVSGLDRHGACAGESCPTVGVSGPSGNAARFDGVDDYVALGNFQIEGRITLAAWVKPQATDGRRNIIVHGYATSPPGEVFLRINNGAYHAGSWDGSDYLAAYPIPPEDVGQWVHLAGVYDGAYWRLYRNGVEVSAAPSAVGAVQVDVAWAVGARGTGTERFFQGTVDDVRLYDRALDGAEIQALYLGAGPVLALHLDEAYAADGSSLADGSGRGNAGLLHSSDGTDNKAVPGKVGAHALRFDGASDYVALGNFQIEGRITLAAWVKPQATDGNRNIIAHGYATSPPRGVFLRINNGAYHAGSWDGSNHLAAYPMPPEDVGQWVHLVGVYDGMYWRLYRNGVEVSAAPSAVGAVQVDAAWAVGARGTGTERFFQGVIDDARLYPRALGQAEVYALYQSAWQPAALAQEGPGVEATSWTARVPAGLEGTYELDLRGWDEDWNRTYPGKPNRTDGAWRGEVDTAAPRVSLTRYPLEGATDRYVAVAEDYNLAETGFQSPCGDAGTADREYYQSPWYAALSGQTPGCAQRLYRLTATCDLPATHELAQVGALELPGVTDARDVARVGERGYACVAAGDAGLRTVDVSDPAHPAEVGAYDTPGHAWDVAVAAAHGWYSPVPGNLAYVADGDAGLRVVNVSDPSNPLEVGAVDTPGLAQRVARVTPFLQVSAGLWAYNCALRYDGAEVCWGMCGSTYPPPQAPGIYAQISTGLSHHCSLRRDNGTVECWGENTYGQATPPAGAFIQVSAGGDHTCALRDDGTVECWGNDDYGQATPPVGAFIQVSAGGDHTCALRGDNTVECWGDNTYEQATPLAEAFTQVSAGFRHTCGLRGGGSVECWGDDAEAQATPPVGVFTQVSAGWDHTCALRDDNTVECWGADNRGQATPPAGTFTQVSAGYVHSCAVRDDGTLDCWGGTSYGWGEGGAPRQPLAFVADGDGGLRVIDVSDPVSPTEVASLEYPGEFHAVAVAAVPGSLSGLFPEPEWRAHVVDDVSGLMIVDVDRPAGWSLTSWFYAVPGWDAQDIAVAKARPGPLDLPTHAYVVTLLGRLYVLDVSDPGNVQVVGVYATPGSPQRVALSGNHLYVVSEGDGLRVWDVTDPDRPVPVGFGDAPGSGLDVAVGPSTGSEQAYAYVTDGSYGLRVLELYDPGKPQQVTACDTSGHCATAGATGVISPGLFIHAMPRVYTDTISISPEFYTVQSPPNALTVTVDGTTIHTRAWSADAPAGVYREFANWTPALDGSDDGPHAIRASVVCSDGQIYSDGVTVTVDTQPPTIGVASTLVTGTHYHSSGLIELTGWATDAGGVERVVVSVATGGQPVGGGEAAVEGQVWRAPWYYTDTATLPDGAVYDLSARVTDVAGRTGEAVGAVTVDVVPPAPVTLTLSSASGPLSPGATLREASPALTLAWNESSDGSGLSRYLVGWTTQSYSGTASTALRVHDPTNLVDVYAAGEAQKVMAQLAGEDVYGNQRWQPFGPIYVDSPLTPDYVVLEDEDGIYHGWMGSGCTLLGVDCRVNQNASDRAALNARQRLYASWDAGGLRLAWSGANWSSDGDLFVYMDTQPGGAVVAYDPYSATVTGTTIYLPGATPSSQANAMAADYLVWVRDSQTAHLLRWDGAVWVGQDTILSDQHYRFDPTLNDGQADLYLPFDWIGIADPASAALDLVALASEEGALRLWAAMPAANPVSSARVIETTPHAGSVQTFALLNRYHWESLDDGLCPNGAGGSQSLSLAAQPSAADRPLSLAAQQLEADAQLSPANADLDVTLTVEPTGMVYRFLGDNLFWLWETLFGDRTGDTSSLFAFADAEHPPLGDGEEVLYTLHYHNRGTYTATGILADVSATYALRLPDGEHLPAELRDHQVVYVGDVGPGETVSATFRALVDLAATDGEYYLPCLATTPEYVCAAYKRLAAVEVAIYDDTYGPSGPPLEWIWADHRVDSAPPQFFGIQQPEYVVAAGTNALHGYAYDAAGVPTMTVEVQPPVGGIQAFDCFDATPEDGQWSCAWNVTASNGGVPPTDGDVFWTRLRPADGFGQVGAWSGWQPFAVDTASPMVTLDVTTTGVVSGSLVRDSAFALVGEVVDGGGVERVEVCVDDTCEQADLHLASGAAAMTYEDVVSPALAIDAGTTCDGGEVVRTFVVTEDFAIGEVSVGLNIEHAHRDDLLVELESPAGTRVRLLFNDGITDTHFAHYDLLLRDAAANVYSTRRDDDPAAPYYDRTARPYEPLRDFAGEGSAGTWTLTICDARPLADDGLYHRSSLVLQPRDTAARSGTWSYKAPSIGALDGVEQVVSLYGVDLVGNRTVDPLELRVWVDNVSPVITVTTAIETAVLTSTIPILDGTASDGGQVSNVFVTVQSPTGRVYEEPATLVGETWSYDLHPLVIGRYTLWVLAEDVIGNVATAGPFEVNITESRRIYLPVLLRNR